MDGDKAERARETLEPALALLAAPGLRTINSGIACGLQDLQPRYLQKCTSIKTKLEAHLEKLIDIDAKLETKRLDPESPKPLAFKSAYIHNCSNSCHFPKGSTAIYICIYIYVYISTHLGMVCRSLLISHVVNSTGS